MRKSDLIDMEAAQRALLIDEPTILELVLQFLYDKDHYIAPLKSSLAQRDWKNLIAYAHRLKGSAYNLRIHGLG
ncbi:MAG: Hpt domain-containing protein [Spirochaetota bacterium]